MQFSKITAVISIATASLLFFQNATQYDEVKNWSLDIHQISIDNKQELTAESLAAVRNEPNLNLEKWAQGIWSIPADDHPKDPTVKHGQIYLITEDRDGDEGHDLAFHLVEKQIDGSLKVVYESPKIVTCSSLGCGHGQSLYVKKKNYYEYTIYSENIRKEGVSGISVFNLKLGKILSRTEIEYSHDIIPKLNNGKTLAFNVFAVNTTTNMLLTGSINQQGILLQRYDLDSFLNSVATSESAKSGKQTSRAIPIMGSFLLKGTKGIQGIALGHGKAFILSGAFERDGEGDGKRIHTANFTTGVVKEVTLKDLWGKGQKSEPEAIYLHEDTIIFGLEGQRKFTFFAFPVELLEKNTPDKMYILGAGQSNMQKYFEGARPAKLYLEQQFPEIDSSIKEANFILGAYGGSAVLQVNVGANKENYWLKQDVNTKEFTPGPRLQETIKIIRQQKTAKKDINYILWAQGEQDTTVINKRILSEAKDETEREKLMQEHLENYKNGVIYIFNELRSAIGSPIVNIGIQVLGQRNKSDTENVEQAHLLIHRVRDMQKSLSKEMLNVRTLANMYDMPLEDSVHMTNEGRYVVLGRIMRNIALQRNGEVLASGAQMAKVEQVSLKKLRVKLVNSGKLILGKDAHFLFSIHDGMTTEFLMRAIYAKKIDSETLELEFPADIPPASKLLTAYGILCTEGTNGYGKSLEQLNRYIWNDKEEKLPIESGAIVVGESR